MSDARHDEHGILIFPQQVLGCGGTKLFSSIVPCDVEPPYRLAIGPWVDSFVLLAILVGEQPNLGPVASYDEVNLKDEKLFSSCRFLFEGPAHGLMFGTRNWDVRLPFRALEKGEKVHILLQNQSGASCVALPMLLGFVRKR